MKPGCWTETDNGTISITRTFSSLHKSGIRTLISGESCEKTDYGVVILTFTNISVILSRNRLQWALLISSLCYLLYPQLEQPTSLQSSRWVWPSKQQRASHAGARAVSWIFVAGMWGACLFYFPFEFGLVRNNHTKFVFCLSHASGWSQQFWIR